MSGKENAVYSSEDSDPTSSSGEEVPEVVEDPPHDTNTSINVEVGPPTSPVFPSSPRSPTSPGSPTSPRSPTSPCGSDDEDPMSGDESDDEGVTMLAVETSVELGVRKAMDACAPRDEFEGVQKRVDDMESSIKNLQASMDLMTSTMESIRSTMESMRGDLKSVKGKMKRKEPSAGESSMGAGSSGMGAGAPEAKKPKVLSSKSLQHQQEKPQGGASSSKKAKSSGPAPQGVQVPCLANGRKVCIVSAEHNRILDPRSTCPDGFAVKMSDFGRKELGNITCSSVYHAIAAGCATDPSKFGVGGSLSLGMGAFTSAYGKDKAENMFRYWSTIRKCDGVVAEVYMEKNSSEFSTIGDDQEARRKYDEGVARAIRRRFEADKEAMDALLATGDEYIIWNSKTRKAGYWKGHIEDGYLYGENKMGVMLMEVRKYLAGKKGKETKRD